MHLVMLAGIVALAAFLRFYDLGRESLWFDEAFSVSVADWDPLATILKLTEIGLRSTDRNVFHLMLHYVLLLGRSETMIRGVPAISGVLSVVALYALGKRLFGAQTGLLAALLLAISPMHVWYSREARGYALMTLFGLLTAYFMMRALADNRPGSWLGYVLLSALGTYTHSFGVLIIGALNLYALLWFAMRRPRRGAIGGWLAAQVMLALALVPFLRGFMGQTTEGWGAWIGDKYGVPSPKTLVFTIGQFSFGTAYDQNRLAYVLALAVFAIPGLAALVAAGRSMRRPGWWMSAGQGLALAAIYLAAPIGVLFVASQVTPLYLDRYLLPFVPPYLLIIAYGLLALPHRVWHSLAVLALLVVSLPSLLSVYQPGQKEDWRAGAAYVAARADDGDLIVFYDAYINIPFNFYYGGKGTQLLISRFAPDDEIVRHADEISSKSRQVWLVLSHADEERLVRQVETHRGVKRTAERAFVGLRILTYEVTPPP